MKNRIYFPQFNKDKVIEPGKTILEYAQELDIPINNGCGGSGICQECRIKIEKGFKALNERTKPEEELNKGERLACQTVIEDDFCDIYVKVLQHGFIDQILTHGEGKREIQLNPLIYRVDDKIFLGKKKIDEYRGGLYGIAADIGTTTVVLHLINLEEGNAIYTSAFENPQKRIDGNNVISRIEYDRAKPGELHSNLISTLNKKIREMPADASTIYEVVVVGNSTMRDLFFGLDVQSLGVRPYKSITEIEGGSTSLNKRSSELNLNINKNANIYSPPLIGSHIGSDTVAVCLATGMFDRTDKIMMCIDIGTNGEVILKSKGEIIATFLCSRAGFRTYTCHPGGNPKSKNRGW